jgi:hypothetical protein
MFRGVAVPVILQVTALAEDHSISAPITRSIM